MKITIETPAPGEEDEIIVRCAALDDKLLHLIYALRERQEYGITGYLEGKIVKLSLKDIFYFEAVDSRVFAYTSQGVYEIRKKLYELESEYSYTDFLRISKSAIVNVSKISYLKPTLSGRFEATLKNNEKMIISRQYVIDLKKKLGI